MFESLHCKSDVSGDGEMGRVKLDQMAIETRSRGDKLIRPSASGKCQVSVAKGAEAHGASVWLVRML